MTREDLGVAHEPSWCAKGEQCTTHHGWVGKAAWLSTVAALSLLLASVTGSCGSDDETGGTGGTTSSSGTGGTGGDGGTGGAGGSGGDSVTADLDVMVLATDPNDTSELIPTAGALVFFDLPSGDQIEATTDDDGMVSFADVVWPAGSDGSVSAYLVDHVMESYLGVSQQTLPQLMAWRGDTVLTLRLWARGAGGDYVAVSGTASNMADVGHRLEITTTTTGGYHEAVGPDWSIDVPVGQGFSLIALEYEVVDPKTVSARGQEFSFIQWAELQHSAVTVATTGVDLDMTNGLTAVEVSGSFAIPQHGLSSFFDDAVVGGRTTSVESRETAMFGHVTRSDVSTDGQTAEYDLEYVTLEGAQLFTHYQLVGSSKASSLMKAGAPVAGVQEGVLPEPVSVPTTAPFADPLPVQTNAVDAADTDLMKNAYLTNPATGTAYWYVRMPSSLTEMDLPELPSSLDPDTVLGSANLRTRIELCALGNTGDYATWCTRWSGGNSVVLQR